MQNQTIFGIVAIAAITGMIIGGHIATIQAEIRHRENLVQFLVDQNYGWYDPATGEFVLLDVQPLQFVPHSAITEE